MIWWLNKVLNIKLVFFLWPKTLCLQVTQLTEPIVSPANGVLKLRDIFFFKILIFFAWLNQDYFIAIWAYLLPTFYKLNENRQILTTVDTSSVWIDFYSPYETIKHNRIRVYYLALFFTLGIILQHKAAFIIGYWDILTKVIN